MNSFISKLLGILTLTLLLCLFAAHTSVYCEEAANSEQTDPSDEFDDDDDFDFIEETFSKPEPSVSDPIAPFNRVMFQFNDRLYFWVLKPVSKGYGKVVPNVARKGIKNFFYNVRAPIRIVGSLLQFKGEKAMAEYSRFLVNTTAGGLGFGDIAKKYPNLNISEEDSGQTLAHYGIGNGFYIVWPVLGPSTLRDTLGNFGDGRYLDPVAYVTPLEAYLEIRALETLNATSLRIGDYETLKKSAIRPYEAFRSAYIQYRNNLISD